MSVLKVNNIQNIATDGIIVDGVVQPAALPSGSVLQVVQTVKTNTQASSVATTNVVLVENLDGAITPVSSSSSILVTFNLSVAISDSLVFGAILYRNGSPLSGAINASPGSRKAATTGTQNSGTRGVNSISMSFLDTSPAVGLNTYQVYLFHESGVTRTIFVNRDNDNIDTNVYGYYVSSITLMEIAG
jgi:hypothetical protein